MEKYLKRKKKCYGKRRQSGNRKIAVADKKQTTLLHTVYPLRLTSVTIQCDQEVEYLHFMQYSWQNYGLKVTLMTTNSSSSHK